MNAKESILKKLPKVQIEALLDFIISKRYNELIKRNFILSKEKAFALASDNSNWEYVNFNLLFPDLIFKTGATKSIAYSNASDWLSLPTFEYTILKKNGELEEIALNKLSEIFNAELVTSSVLCAAGIGERDDLQGCVDISIEDIMKLKSVEIKKNKWIE